MAKSEDYPGKQKTAPTWMSGVKPSVELPEPNLKVSVKEMLQQQRAPQEKPATKTTEAKGPTLSPSSTGEVFTPAGVLADISLEQIHVSPYQPRLVFSEAAIEDLANSIAAVGLAKPITVRPIGAGFYELVGGERRWRAHKLLGRDTITSYVREMDDAMARILALTDNEGQEALTEYERGKSYSSILASGGEPSIRALARRVGVNHSIISRCLLLMELPAEILEILDKNPGLIGGKWAKDFIEFSRSESDLLFKAVISMRDNHWTQEHALRWIAKEVSARDQRRIPSKFTEREISGVGKVRVDGKKLEFRCAKKVDAARLADQFESFLKTLDRSLIQRE